MTGKVRDDLLMGVYVGVFNLSIKRTNVQNNNLKEKAKRTIYKCNIGIEFRQTVTHLRMFAILCVVSIIYMGR